MRSIRALVGILAVLVGWCLVGTGCGSGGVQGVSAVATAATNTVASSGVLNASYENLIFVVTPDLANNNGDVNPATANLSGQGLQRVIRLAAFVQSTLLGSASPGELYGLEPATHLQNGFPDLVPLEFLEQLSVLEQYTEDVLLPQPPTITTGDSFPIDVSFTLASLPSGAAVPPAFYPSCQGLDFADSGGDNETLVNAVIARRLPRAYVFALPFATFQSLLAQLKVRNDYHYSVPAAWAGTNTVYVLTVPAGSLSIDATLTAVDTHVQVGTGYPQWTIPLPSTATPQQTPVEIQPATLAGSSVPATINRSETLYLVRHAEAHPSSSWEDGNLVTQGDWRALYLPEALAGKITRPDVVYAVDPSQAILGMPSVSDPTRVVYSYVRTSQTVAPYAIANGIPFRVASGFQWTGIDAASEQTAIRQFVDFFFTGGSFSNRTVLVSWEHDHIPVIAQALLDRYFANSTQAPTVPTWPGNDYDSIWSFTLDASGNLTFSNKLFEGIDSAALPSSPPSF